MPNPNQNWDPHQEADGPKKDPWSDPEIARQDHQERQTIHVQSIGRAALIPVDVIHAAHALPFRHEPTPVVHRPRHLAGHRS